MKLTAAVHLCNILTLLRFAQYLHDGEKCRGINPKSLKLKKRNLRFKDFLTYRGWQRRHVKAALIRGSEQPRCLRAAGLNYRGVGVGVRWGWGGPQPSQITACCDKRNYSSEDLNFYCLDLMLRISPRNAVVFSGLPA